MKAVRLLNFICVMAISAHAHSAETLSYSGRLVNPNGSPVTGPVSLQFNLDYSNNIVVNDPLCSKTVNSVPLTNGVFHVKLDYLVGDCKLGATILKVLSEIPVGESIAIQVKDLTSIKTYDHQAIHSIPSSITASVAKTLDQMGATTGQVLKWDGTKWAPGTGGSGGTGNGTVTAVRTGQGLTGGPVTVDGTISIPFGGITTPLINDQAITNQKVSMAAAIDQSKIANLTTDLATINTTLGTKISRSDLSASVPLIYNNSTGAFSISAASTTASGSMSAADKVKVDGMETISSGNGLIERFGGVLRSTTCAAGMLLKWNSVTGWDCSADISTDSSRVAKAGDTMTGDLTLETQLKLKDGAAGSYVTLRAPLTGTTSHTLTLPAALGTSGQVLTTDNSGLLSWTTVSAGSTALGGELSGTAASATIVANTITSAKILDGSIVNDDVNASAAIAQTKIANLTSDLAAKLPLAGGTLTGNLILNTQMLFKDSTTNFVTLKAPSTVSASHTMTLPAAAGTAGQVLATDASGNLSWSTVASGATAVGGDLSGTVSSSTIIADAVNSSKILDGSIMNIDINGAAAIDQSKINGLTTDLTTINTSLGTKIALTNLSGSAPITYNSSSGAFSISAATTTVAGSMSAADKVKVDGMETISSGDGLIERFGATFRSNTCSSGQVLKWNGIGGWMCDNDIATDALKLPLAGGTMSGVINMGGNLINNLGSPAVATDAATRGYVDGVISANTPWAVSGPDVSRASGNVGIGESNPSAKLEVNGDIVSKTFDAAAATSIDWSKSNTQITTTDNGPIAFTNLRDGGSYSLVCKGTVSVTHTFSQAGLTFMFQPSNGPTIANTHTVYTLVRAGSIVYVSWITGFN